MIFPFIVGGGAFAIGGIGPGVFAFVLAGICVVITGGFERRFERSVRDSPGSHASEDIVGRFRRLWLVSLIVVLLGVVIIFVGGGMRAGAVALVCGIIFVAGGAVALAIMRNREA
jgi:hypothetical protein